MAMMRNRMQGSSLAVYVASRWSITDSVLNQKPGCTHRVPERTGTAYLRFWWYRRWVFWRWWGRASGVEISDRGIRSRKFERVDVLRLRYLELLKNLIAFINEHCEMCRVPDHNCSMS